jgi:hypothetical protein
MDRDNAGFDRLEILTHTRADTVRSVLLEGVELDPITYTPEIHEDRLLLSFPKVEGVEDNLVRLEVQFDAAVLRYGTKFTGWVFNSDDPDSIRQQISPGNATFRFSGDDLSVRTPIGGDLLIDVEVSSNPFTPNGDGINDELILDYRLLQVTIDRPVSLQIFDLAGRQVGIGAMIEARSGVGRQRWDGMGLDGLPVAPGTYIYRLFLGTGEDELQLGTVSIAY